VADPSSWLALEAGRKVVAAGGDEAGKVEDVLGDTVADIFDGLTVSTRLLGKPKYVPAELVASIDTDAVHLTIGKDDVERLDEYTPPAAEVP
jgi:hypothetical protein